ASILPPPPISPLFPYTTLFRSYMSMSELISLPDFLYHIHAITEPYFVDHPEIKKAHEHHSVIDELEQINIKRLIARALDERDETDRKSTRLNSSQVSISYAVFC